MLKKEKVLVKTGIFISHTNNVMRGLFMLQLKGVTLFAFYCSVRGSLSKDVFERCTLTGSESLSLLICLDATKLVLLSVFTLIETNCSKICFKSRPKIAKTAVPEGLTCAAQRIAATKATATGTSKHQPACA